MHETVFAKDAIRIAKQKLIGSEKGSRVAKINVVLSKKSHVSPETLKSTFQMYVKGTPFESANLEIDSQDNPEKEFYVKSIEIEK